MCVLMLVCLFFLTSIISMGFFFFSDTFHFCFFLFLANRGEMMLGMGMEVAAIVVFVTIDESFSTYTAAVANDLMMHQ